MRKKLTQADSDKAQLRIFDLVKQKKSLKKKAQELEAEIQKNLAIIMRFIKQKNKNEKIPHHQAKNGNGYYSV